MSTQPLPNLVPPFTRETAAAKVRKAEDNWNSRDPEKVSLGYTVDSKWRNRAEFVNGRQEIVAFLRGKWRRELDYRLIKELWAFDGARIAVRFAYESHDDSGNWYRSYGNENWEFNENGVMHHRYACINDLPIKESDRKFHWPLGRRPDDHPGLWTWVCDEAIGAAGINWMKWPPRPQPSRPSKRSGIQPALSRSGIFSPLTLPPSRLYGHGS